jgi:NADPH-dependent 2,4-dienoyl-CoA reductase/sulfur reductase-like enzyme/rhodanese-related sulfurtransferase
MSSSVEFDVPNWDTRVAQLRIVILGGEAGGLSAATRARRMNEHASIALLESSNVLAMTPEQLARRYRIDARVRHHVERIDRAHKRVEGVDRATGIAFSLHYDRLVLAAREEPVVPEIPGCDAANVFTVDGDDARRLDAYLTESVPVSAVVVGSGFAALESVQALTKRGLNVTLLEAAAHALPALDAEMSGWLEAELARHGVQLLVKHTLRALGLAADGLVEAVETESGERIATELVLFALGGRPDPRLAAQAGLALGARGKILVDAHFCTSDPHIYALGAAVETRSSAARTTAAESPGTVYRQGRSVGEHAATGRARAIPSEAGTSIVRVFGLDVGVSGLGLRAARERGYDADSVIVHGRDRADSFSRASLHLLVVYERGSGKLLGVQAIGPSGVEKCIDVIAAALHFGATLNHLADLDLACSPRLSADPAPVQVAAFVAQDQEREPDATTPEPLAGAQLVDVRDASETRAGMLPSAVHIPLDELRERLSELDRARPIVVYSEVGRRGYVARRILLQHGFLDVRNLRGGYTQLHRRLQRAPAARDSLNAKRSTAN